MPKKKLTAKLKEEIRTSHRTLKKSDFSGDALAYLNRVRGAAKARKIKKDTTIVIEGHKVPRNSHTYQVLEATAKDLHVKPADLIKKHPEAVRQFVQKGKFFFNREADYLKEDVLKVSGKVFLNGKQVKKSYARYVLTRLKNRVAGSGAKYHIVNIEHYYDGEGNLHLSAPTPKDYNKLDDDDFFDMLEDDYGDIQTYGNK